MRDFIAAFFTLLFPFIFLFAAALLGGEGQPSRSFTIGIAQTSGSAFEGTAPASLTPLMGAIRTALESRPGVLAYFLTAGEAETAISSGKAGAVLLLGPDDATIVGKAAVMGMVGTLVRSALLDVSCRQNGAAGGAPADPPSECEWRPKERVLPDGTRPVARFMLPGLFTLGLLQLGLFGTANPLLQARQMGILRHYTLTPLPTGVLVLSHVVFRVILAMIQIALLLLAARWLFGVGILGEWPFFWGVTLIGAAAMIGLGYLIGGTAPSAQAGVMILMVLNFVLMFFGQIFTDFSGNPTLFAICRLFPVAYLSDGFRQVILGDPGEWSLALDMTVGALWAAATIVLSIRFFRFDTRKQ